MAGVGPSLISQGRILTPDSVSAPRALTVVVVWRRACVPRSSQSRDGIPTSAGAAGKALVLLLEGEKQRHVM